MKFVAIIALLFVLSEARLPVPYDVYVRFGGKPLPQSLRREGELYYLTDEKTNGSKIVGGGAAGDDDAKWIVSLLYRGSFFCGGSIKDQNTIITAAHCVLGDSPSDLSIRYNSRQHSTGGIVLAVSAIRVHKDYSSSTIDYDVAILKLTSNIDFGQSRAQAVKLPAQGFDPPETRDTLVAGWGTTLEGGSISTNLQMVTVPIVSRTVCRSQYGSSAITDRMICAGIDAGGKDACQGDSGGPLTVDGELWGIVSWGRGCARPGFAGVYSNVGPLRSWIDENSS